MSPLPPLIDEARAAAATLSHEEIRRYSRHLLLPEVTLLGQQRLKAAKVLIVGTGGLGAPLALYLAAAGVGTIGLVDFDTVDESNLQRQIIHSTRDVDRPKTASARDRLRALNPYVQVVEHNTTLTSENALDIIGRYDLVADGTDNYPTRYLVNDACVFQHKPAVYGSIFQFEGQAAVFWADHGPCYRCLYPTPPPPGLVPNCSEGGVLGVLPGIVGTIQATEALKLLLGGGDPLVGRLLLSDAWGMTFRQLKIDQDPNCPVCGTNPTVTELVDYEQFCGLKPSAEEKPVNTITARELKNRLDAGERIQVVDIREPHEWSIAKFDGALAIPLAQLYRRVDELDPTVDTVVLCKVGTRSVFAIKALEQAGYTGPVYNLQDGLNAWTREVDPSQPEY
jgi:adenylyltransferase/sulfurtransferase